MRPKKVFKNVLTEYFRYVLIKEMKWNNRNKPYLPNSRWFHLSLLPNYFPVSDIDRLYEQYFTEINPIMKIHLIKKDKSLKPYFKEKLWYQEDPEDYLNEQANNIFAKFVTETVRQPQNGRAGEGTSRNSYYISSEDEDVATAPPAATNRDTVNEGASTSRNSYYIEDPEDDDDDDDEDEPPRNAARNNNNNNDNVCSRCRSPVRSRAPRRKRLKLYTYLNELPNELPDLQPHESTLLLQSLDGSPLNDLNIPLPVCKKIKKKCLKYDPRTKRYAKYIDDGSETIPLNMVLKY